jgi:hypothetical protein
MVEEQLHENQLAAIYGHYRDQRRSENQLKAKDRRTRLPPRQALAAALSRDEHAAFSLGKLPVGLVPWLQYQRRSRSTITFSKSSVTL